MVISLLTVIKKRELTILFFCRLLNWPVLITVLYWINILFHSQKMKEQLVTEP